MLMARAGLGSGAGNSGCAIKVRDKVGGTVLLIQTGKNGSNAGLVLVAGMWWVV